MNKNKKLAVVSGVLLLSMLLIFSACKKKGNPSGNHKDDTTKIYYVTDENGVPVTDENGENVTLVMAQDAVVVTDANGRPLRDEKGNIITVVLETEVSEIINANGENVYDENGEKKTTIIYHSKDDVKIPVTDKNGEFVTNKKGEVEMTEVTIPSPTTEKTIDIPMVDPNGNKVTDANGNEVTYTQTVTDAPVNPGNNTANWSSTFGGSENDKFVDVAPMSDGGYVGLLQSNSTDGSMADLAGNSETPIPVLIRYSKEGRIVWKKAISSDMGMIVRGLATDKKDNIAICGYSQAENLGVTAKGEYDAVIFKFDKDGKKLWVNSFAGSGVDGFENIAATPDGDFVTVGYSGSKDGSAAIFHRSERDSSSIVVKYDANGKQVFAKAIGKNQDTLTSAAVAPDGSIYVAGNFTSTEKDSLFQIVGRSDGGVIKLSAKGDMLWKKSYGDTQIENYNDIAVTPNGGCVVVGRSNSDNFDFPELLNQGGYDAIMLEYKADGTEGFKRSFKGFYDDTFTSIVATSNGYTLAGYSNSSNRDFKPLGNRGNMDAFLITVNSRGDLTSAQGFGGSKNDRFTAVCVTTGNEIIACGYTHSMDGDLVGAKYPTGDTKKSLGMIARFK